MRRLAIASLLAFACGPAPVTPSTPPPAVAPPSPRFPDVTLPSSNATEVPPAGLPVVVVSKTTISLEGESALVPLPADRAYGVDVRYKRSSPYDFMIVPLGEALSKRKSGEGAFAFDASTPYRLFVEVLFTAGQSEITKFHVLVKNGDTVADISSTPPRSARPEIGVPWFNLTVFLVGDGISMKGRGGNVAPGCNDVGPGLSIPKKNGGYDFEALRACAARLHSVVPEASADRHVTIAANANVELRDLVSAIDAMRPSFSEIIYGLAR
jgi:hypothetical protein